MAKRGQPTKYHPSHCDVLLDYFDREPYFTTAEGADKACDLPTFSGFARSLGIHRATISRWTKDHAEFAEAYALAKECQEHILVTNGLRGLYQHSFAIFASKNMIGWRDKQPGEDDKPPVTPTIQVTTEQLEHMLKLARGSK